MWSRPFVTWSSTCVITYSTGKVKFKITNTKRLVPVVTLSSQDNAKLLQQLKPGLEKQLTGININQIRKHMPKKNI